MRTEITQGFESASTQKISADQPAVYTIRVVEKNNRKLVGTLERSDDSFI